MSVESAPRGTVLAVEIVVDVTLRTVVLSEPDDTAKFALRVLGSPVGDVSAVSAVLAETRTGRLSEAGDAFVAPNVVRRLAAGSVGEGWEQRFAEMLEYASARGWTDASDGSVQAHVIWDGAG
jgi:hypothetical protein